MDYEQKYKEARERMKSWVRGEHPECFCEAQKAAEFIFPELAESEDERIRKELIEHIKANKEADYVLFKKFSPDDVIAWLEKQGENKPDEKVKPKFKVGDWIVQRVGVYKVIEVCESWYEVVDNKDNHFSIGFAQEYMCHLWTIIDAKDGDVLAVENRPFIYNGKINPIGGYCGICTNGLLKFYVECSGYGSKCWTMFDGDIYPATKEQRDLLFQKMKEAGYEWDSENKELKKMEYLKDVSYASGKLIDKFRKDLGL